MYRFVCVSACLCVEVCVCTALFCECEHVCVCNLTGEEGGRETRSERKTERDSRSEKINPDGGRELEWGGEGLAWLLHMVHCDVR